MLIKAKEFEIKLLQKRGAIRRENKKHDPTLGQVLEHVDVHTRLVTVGKEEDRDIKIVQPKLLGNTLTDWTNLLLKMLGGLRRGDVMANGKKEV